LQQQQQQMFLSETGKQKVVQQTFATNQQTIISKTFYTNIDDNNEKTIDMIGKHLRR
jgi:uncharacterized protein YcgL (UPF0745 family)